MSDEKVTQHHRAFGPDSAVKPTPTPEVRPGIELTEQFSFVDHVGVEHKMNNDVVQHCEGCRCAPGGRGALTAAESAFVAARRAEVERDGPSHFTYAWLAIIDRLTTSEAPHA